MTIKVCALAIALACGCVSAASAATMFKKVEFTANNLSGPTPKLSGSVTFSYDDVADTYALLGVDFTLGTTVFNVQNTGIQKSPFAIAIGGVANGVGSVTPGQNDFAIAINPGTFTGRSFIYSVAGANTSYLSTAVTTRVTDVPPPVAAVPEPAGWATMIAGFGLLGGVMRRRKARVRFAV